MQALRSYLVPWVTWIGENGGQPTTQRILAYLEAKEDLTRSSFSKIGHAIVDFTNRYVEQWDRVNVVPPLGQRKKKPTLAMPRAMVKALTDHVVAEARSLAPAGSRCQVPEADKMLAKHLGK